MRPALKPGLLPLWRDRDTIQIGIDPRRAVALTGMAGAAWLIGLLDGSRNRDQLIAAAAQHGIPAELSERVLAILAAAGVLDDFPAAMVRALPPAARTQLAAELATASLARGDSDGGARTLARRVGTMVRIYGGGRIATTIAQILLSSGVATVELQPSSDPAGADGARGNDAAPPASNSRAARATSGGQPAWPASNSQVAGPACNNQPAGPAHSRAAGPAGNSQPAGPVHNGQPAGPASNSQPAGSAHSRAAGPASNDPASGPAGNSQPAGSAHSRAARPASNGQASGSARSSQQAGPARRGRAAGTASRAGQLPDLAILVGHQGPELPGELVSRRVPHLSASASEAIGVVGPLVLPGRSACLRCLDLARAERDPAWPLLLAQLAGKRLEPMGCDTVLATTVAAQASSQALAFIDDPLAGATVNGTLELVLPSWQWRRRSWLPRLDCSCRPASSAEPPGRPPG